MIGILAVGLGNIGSLNSAIYNLGFNTKLVSSINDFDEISHLVLPGVGNYSAAANDLKKRKLFDRIVEHASIGKPIMGICLGMQLLSTSSEEGSFSEGLNLIPGKVVKIPQTKNLRVPHMGWNDIQMTQEHPIFEGVRQGVDFYFVHSYYFQPDRNEATIGIVDYGSSITAAVGLKNIIGTQFHPEKSQKNGLKIIENFCFWDGKC